MYTLTFFLLSSLSKFHMRRPFCVAIKWILQLLDAKLIVLLKQNYGTEEGKFLKQCLYYFDKDHLTFAYENRSCI